MSVENLLRQPLRVPFGKGYDVPPPSARVGLRVQRIASATMGAQASGEPIDLAALLAAMGVGVDYDVNRDLLGDLYEPMLDDLTSEEFGRVVRAVGVWAMPGATRELAEETLTGPTVAPPRNRAARRAATKAVSTGAVSKSTGTS